MKEEKAEEVFMKIESEAEVAVNTEAVEEVTAIIDPDMKVNMDVLIVEEEKMTAKAQVLATAIPEVIQEIVESKESILHNTDKVLKGNIVMSIENHIDHPREDTIYRMIVLMITDLHDIEVDLQNLKLG